MRIWGRPARARALALLVAGAGLVAGCSQSAAPRKPAISYSVSVRIDTPSPTPAAGPSPPRGWPAVLPVPAARTGQHQTGARPPASSTDFHAEMVDLWAAIASGRPDLGLPAFFPLVAYEQVKAIADPAADWHNRLVGEFREDVLAAHALLDGRGRDSTLVRVVVPESESDWIGPGVCDNGVGYWHVNNSRLVYRVGSQERSIGISTLISWRGRWYVVHLGGEDRTSAGGMVDEPEPGLGTPGPPGGC
jgi:hypothetical protein